MPVPETITKLIEGSGNNFHAKVARWFTEHGWAVAVSPYYMDQTLSKARELDLIVEKAWPINDRYGRATGDVVVIRLLLLGPQSRSRNVINDPVSEMSCHISRTRRALRSVRRDN